MARWRARLTCGHTLPDTREPRVVGEEHDCRKCGLRGERIKSVKELPTDGRPLPSERSEAAKAARRTAGELRGATQQSNVGSRRWKIP